MYPIRDASSSFYTQVFNLFRSHIQAPDGTYAAKHVGTVDSHAFTSRLYQAAIANILGISQTRYSKYEIGTCEIPLDILIRLARLYNTSIDYLLGETNNPKRYD